MSLLTRTLRQQLKPSPLTRSTISISRTTGNRTMASAPETEKFEWLVIMPDQPGKLAKRMEVRPSHFAGLKPKMDSGFWKMGGALLEEVPKEGEQMKMLGSAMVASASSKEELLEILKNDIYAKSEVWDFDKIQVYPFKCAFRIPHP
ncbi:uncharacterized protein K444DRAFT_617258 [Hyaloscypha bicolor E]|uniref:YCII-related domain-containing protein n=1 Tax=Hyaloscypha bicolor E TaxID=1095630 RepID=A0A2J6SXS9_9HELO|nr:uncharacterized protein K444DRAFT_617258 [Hyaloscypha bicolor E]PMD55575.1 hypothetical protein K444DRAFT_617258 [Hyaloscypha bicolor E]